MLFLHEFVADGRQDPWMQDEVMQICTCAYSDVTYAPLSPYPASCSIPSPSPSLCPSRTPARLFPWQQQNPLWAYKRCLSLLGFSPRLVFLLFSQTLAAGFWLLPILALRSLFVFFSPSCFFLRRCRVMGKEGFWRESAYA